MSQDNLLPFLNELMDKVTRLQARLDATESLAVCLFDRLNKEQREAVLDTYLDRAEAVADAKPSQQLLEVYREESQKLLTVLSTRRPPR